MPLLWGEQATFKLDENVDASFNKKYKELFLFTLFRLVGYIDQTSVKQVGKF